MATMLAAFLPGDSTVNLREVPLPPGICQVLNRIDAGGLQRLEPGKTGPGSVRLTLADMPAGDTP